MEDFDMPPPEEMMNDDLDLPDEGPILKVGEEKEIGKQGLKKKLLKDGQGWDTPDNGDEVEGTLHAPLSIVYFALLLPFCSLFVEMLLFSSLHGNSARWDQVRFQPR
jgi:hypothetical protein